MLLLIGSCACIIKKSLNLFIRSFETQLIICNFSNIVKRKQNNFLRLWCVLLQWLSNFLVNQVTFYGKGTPNNGVLLLDFQKQIVSTFLQRTKQQRESTAVAGLMTIVHSIPCFNYHVCILTNPVLQVAFFSVTLKNAQDETTERKVLLLVTRFAYF